MQVISSVDPFTYAVHALKCLLLKDTRSGAITGLAFLIVFSVVTMGLATRMFRRTL
jgi:ABC-type multidrug transport system permease subunit